MYGNVTVTADEVRCSWDPGSPGGGRMRVYFGDISLSLSVDEADRLVAALLAAMATQTSDVFLSLHGQGGAD